ncbi:hypothetical protein H310_11665 [Aphanomyces invadans]|uniref:Tc1-like transposase DDE domain-containing protein n=1 Tax=Aphanomyces invadans TaxID=157072 RepID=A0A024TKK9_9STRA|nr:hypothetical protein H310_11665 [Aphanomyces invadans]ETV94685.1 hypothetical protein H310_11665 [Aphanomyces invadans]|eukprot:XP_008876630.1 hypothetical protein H310_11665 [Aphanomyces invadans]
MKKSKGPTADEKQRVLDAHLRGDDWSLIAQHNGMSYATAWRVVNSGRTMLLPRGGVRTGQKKVTAEIRDALENKQVRIETATCNNDVNKQKRREFALKLKQHQINGDFIVYYDETNFNLYCKRSFRRAKKGKRATVVLPPSKGPNLQVQCAVSAEQGLSVKRSDAWRDHFAGKRMVIVLDNAPAHSQTESRVVQHYDISLLRLGPYSPMLNPIESCFSVFKARVKSYLVLHTDAMLERGEYGTFLERRMILLEDAAQESISCITNLW